MNEKQADTGWKKKKSHIDYARQKERQGIHVMKECNYSGIDKRIEDVMSEEGQRIQWMKRVKKKLKGNG